VPTVSRPGVHIEWTPDPIVFGRAILEVDKALNNTIVPMEWAAREMQMDIQERFETETDPDNQPWTDWSENYEEFAHNYPNIGILTQSAELAQAVTSDEAIIVNSHTVFFNENVMPERGYWHQYGAPDRKTKSGASNPLPERRFLGLTVQTRAYIFAMFEAWFDEAIQVYTTSLGRWGRRHAAQGVHPITGRHGFVPRSTPMIKLPPHRRG